MSGSHSTSVRGESERLGFQLRRVKILNFKSIRNCKVDLKPLTVLVGRNGSGKSNFLDALGFVSEALRGSIDQAIRDRGGPSEVIRRGGPPRFSIQIELALPWAQASYGFKIRRTSRDRGRGFGVDQENLRIFDAAGSELAHYHVEGGGRVRSSIDPMPPSAPDRLYLATAAAMPAFRQVYDTVLATGFYHFNVEAMKALQPPDAGHLLSRDGRNLASVIARLAAERPEAMTRILSYLATIVPGILDVERETLGPRETLAFSLGGGETKRPRKFYAYSMSDGTLRALGALVAVNQLASSWSPVRLVGIEEPETALHPAASGALMDALREAASHTQVLVTTHSPDLLDQIDLQTDHLLAVQASQGETQIGPVDPASRRALLDHLYTAGDLLRMDQLEPDRADLQRQVPTTLPRGAGDP